MSTSVQTVQPLRNNDTGLGASQKKIMSGSLAQLKKENSLPESANHSKGAPSTKRESSTPNNTSEGKENSCPEDEKRAKKRRKVNHACVYCRRSHMTCDQARPCSRCIKRDIGHLCHDEPREPKKTKSEGEIEGEEDTTSPLHHPRSMSGQLSTTSQIGSGFDAMNDPLASHGVQETTSLAASTNKLNSNQPFNNNHQLYNDWNAQNDLGVQDIHSYPLHDMFNTSEVSNEYSLLNDFFNNSLLDDGALYPGDDAAMNMYTDPSFMNTLGPGTTGTFLSNHFNQLAPSENAADGEALKRPASTARIDDKAQEKYYMTAADPAGTEPADDRMNKLLKAKYDAGLLKPFNYVKGYARLNQYMEKHMHPNSRQKILRQLENFRPMFRERMRSLTDVELVKVEMWFEMRLMEYDRVFASMAIPACCWRRTGEIFRGNREMAELINVPVEQLREGKVAIHDILGEQSLVMYWAKFGSIAFDASKKAILASCTLKRLNSEGSGNDIPCCFSFTVQRDEHLIPSIIIGNFLPVATGDG